MKKAALALILLVSVCLAAAPARGVWEKRPRLLGDEGSILFELGKAEGGDFYVEGLPVKGADFGELKVVGTETLKNAQGVITARMDVIVFGVGEIRAAPLQLKVLTEKGEAVFEGSIDPVTVARRLEGSEPPPSLAGLVELPKPFPLLQWILAAAGVIILAGAVLFFIRRKPSAVKGRKEELTAESSPDEWIIKRLKAYVAKSLLSLQDYADLAYDIRLYLEKRAEIRALESTTMELEAMFSAEKPFRKMDTSDLMSVFTFCDSVKFARHFPDAGEEAKLKVILRDMAGEVEASMREEKKAA